MILAAYDADGQPQEVYAGPGPAPAAWAAQGWTVTRITLDQWVEQRPRTATALSLFPVTP